MTTKFFLAKSTKNCDYSSDTHIQIQFLLNWLTYFTYSELFRVS